MALVRVQKVDERQPSSASLHALIKVTGRARMAELILNTQARSHLYCQLERGQTPRRNVKAGPALPHTRLPPPQHRDAPIG